MLLFTTSICSFINFFSSPSPPFSPLVLFNPFSFLVCSLLKSWCSMCTRPNLLPNASYDTFFFLVGYRERQHVFLHYICTCLLGNFIIIMLIPSVMDLALNRCQGIETHMTANEKISLIINEITPACICGLSRVNNNKLNQA